MFFVSSQLGLGGIKLLGKTAVFSNPEGMIFNTVKKSDTPLPIKLIRRCCIEVM